jgi:hypothetical protein
VSRAATFARLTAFDTRRMAANPLLWVGTAGTAYLYSWPRYWNPDAPTLTEYHANMEGSAALVAVTAAAVVCFPAMREAGHSRRTVAALGPTGRLLALGTASVLLTTAIMAALALVDPLLRSVPPAGTLSPYAYPLPFLLAATGPLASIAVVAWTRTYAPLVVLSLAVPALVLYQFSAVDLGLDNAVYQISRVTALVQRPFTVHGPSITPLAALQLAYSALAVALLVAVVAAVRARPARRRALLGAAAALLAGVVVTVGCGRAAYPYGTTIPLQAMHGAEGDQCQVREGITYCPLPGYEPWVDEWHGVLGPSLALLPEAARPDLPVVWQDGDSYVRAMDVPAERTVTVYEFLETGDPYARAVMVGSAGLATLGLGEYAWEWCEGTGEARFVVVAWLTSTAPDVPPAERLDAAAMMLSGFSPSPADLELLRALMDDVPRQRMVDTLEEGWDRLSTPTASTLELADLVGVSVSGNAHTPATADDWARVFPALDPDHYQAWGDSGRCP